MNSIYQRGEWKRNCQKLDDIAKSLLQSLDNIKLQCEIESSDLQEISINESSVENDLQPNSNVEQHDVVKPQHLEGDKTSSQVLRDKTFDPIHPTEQIERNQENRAIAGVDIKELFRNAIKTGKWEEVVGALNIDKAMFLQIIDGGGQPSFQEIFPLLINGPSLTVLVFKLTDDLEALHKVQYQPESQSEGQKTWQDTYIVKDIISHALASFAVSHNDTPFPCKMLLVGTHKDKLDVSQDLHADKERNEMEKIVSIFWQLYGWLHPSKAFESIQVQTIEDLITGIDNYNKHDVMSIKKKIKELMLLFGSQDIPAPWLVFDFVLHKFAELKKLRKIGKSNTEEIADICGVTEDINVVLD